MATSTPTDPDPDDPQTMGLVHSALNLTVRYRTNLRNTVSTLFMARNQVIPLLSERQCRELARTTVFSLPELLNIFHDESIWRQ